MTDKFSVQGYDKDMCAYIPICKCESAYYARIIAHELIKRHTKQEICREDNSESFDWFEIWDNNSNTLFIYTCENPEGIPKCKQICMPKERK